MNMSADIMLFLHLQWLNQQIRSAEERQTLINVMLQLSYLQKQMSLMLFIDLLPSLLVTLALANTTVVGQKEIYFFLNNYTWQVLKPGSRTDNLPLCLEAIVQSHTEWHGPLRDLNTYKKLIYSAWRRMVIYKIRGIVDQDFHKKCHSSSSHLISCMNCCYQWKQLLLGKSWMLRWTECLLIWRKVQHICVIRSQ